MRAGAPVIAVDLPSGVNGTTGAVMGSAVNATQTVTFFRRKVGHLLLPGRLHCGAIQVADIGIPASVLETIKPTAFANRPALWGGCVSAPARRWPQIFARPCRGGVGRPFDHRGGAAGGARRACGRGRGSSPSPARARRSAVNAAASLAVMVRPVDGAAELDRLSRRQAAQCGGAGAGRRGRAGDAGAGAAALASEAAVVLDADALTSFAEEPKALAGHGRQASTRDVVLTPHEGEFARLFKAIHEDLEVHAKLEKTRLAARSSGAIVLLKGADTVVAAPDGRASIADNAPPTLATAGSGDVLAGMIAGLLAQGMPAFEAASAAAWLHGEAAMPSSVPA